MINEVDTTYYDHKAVHLRGQNVAFSTFLDASYEDWKEHGEIFSFISNTLPTPPFRDLSFFNSAFTSFPIDLKDG